MADNVTVNSVPVATRSVTYSGDAAQNVQAVALVTVSGSDDAKTATDLSSTNPLPTNPLPTSTALTAATWTSATALNTNLDIVTEGVGTLRISITANTAASGNLRLYRDTEAMQMFITDNVINNSWFRYGPADSYAINGTTGDIYVNPGGASKIQLRLVGTISSGSVTVTPYVSAVPFIGPTGVVAEDTASQNADFGMPMLFVRKATPANTSGTDGDYEFGQISGGRQWVSALIDTALPAGTNVIGAVAGDVAHDAADSGNPMKVGVKAANALPTAVSNADRANAIGDLYGRQLVSHIDPAMSMWKQVEATTAQTGTAIWTPTSGKKIAVTSVLISTGGTTAGVVTVWFGASADTTFTQGTDQVVFRGELAPSTTSRPGVVLTPATPYFAATVDHVLRYTTSAGITIYITVYGYEL